MRRAAAIIAVSAAILLLLFAVFPLRAAAPPAKVCRSAVTGKVVTAGYAAAHPSTTVCARRRPARR